MELAPIRTVVTSFASQSLHVPDSTSTSTGADLYENGVWALHVAANSSREGQKWISAALSSGDICTYDQERLQLIHAINRVHGDASITDLTVGGENLLSTSGTDGSVCLFDIRQPSVALRFQLTRSEEALSVSVGYDGAIAAVGGSRAEIHFHDLRQSGSLLGSYVDCHTEEVTRVRFQPNPNDEGSTTPTLVSASEDGLVCVFDTSQPSEEAALTSVLNVLTPLREIGFFGPSYEGLYCLTGSETMSIWHHNSAQRICDFGVDLRTKLSRAAGGLRIDYLVSCSWDTTLNKLSLLSGNSNGAAAVFNIDAGTITVKQVLRGGHKGCIRSWCPTSETTFVTGGEDARLCEWSLAGTENPSAVAVSDPEKPTETSENRSRPARREKKKHTLSPY